MTLVRETSPIRLRDYRPPAWSVEAIELEIDLGIDSTEVSSRLTLRSDASQPTPLRLDGEGLELLAIALDGRKLEAQDYHYGQSVLEIHGARDGSVLETRVRVQPAANTTLEGLYLSGSREHGFLLTQCEAEGFRHISFFPDRPDVLARYTVTLRADRERFPVLLAGGNPAGSGDLPDGRHWARFVDPHPKPSYLFALVAGRLQNIQRNYLTADGRQVQLVIWSEANVIDSCHYALDALERSMRWDERSYGRSFDLDVFHVVATHDFNMGAMENKGLNIFNAKYLLADPDTSTDDEYRAVEAVVAHEYFHNWTGNRVTCRDWFQLSLKEGLTVFREQQFSADMNSAPLKRIEDVALLRRTQFPEDAGPLAHPVRPAEYREINNFYTATVYEKGSELVRMVAGRLGQEGFRRGMDLYFQRHDGHAATIEDFLAALGDANHIDLTAYLAWYSQAGTPHLHAKGEYDATRQEYTLTLSQLTRPTPGDAEKKPLPIPVKLSLFNRAGQMLPLQLNGEAQGDSVEKVIVLGRPTQRFVFKQVPSAPVPSLLRGFSAPVVLEYDYSPDELALLLAHDVDGFNRWEAGQQLAMLAFDTLRDGDDSTACKAWCNALAALFTHDAMDDALLADLLTPPGEIEFADRQSEVDPARIHAQRETMQLRLAERIGIDALLARYRALAAHVGEPQLDAMSQAGRRLKRRVLELLALVDAEQAYVLAARQYDMASGMTDRLAALSLLVRRCAPQAASALAHFRERYAGNPLALDKWFNVQAQVPGEPALAVVKNLESDPAFTLKNPNRARSLLGAFASTNPSGFHRADGAAYPFVAERLVQLDALNPQIAARLATAFNGWQRLEPQRRSAARQALEALVQREGLSPNLSEIVGNVLQH
ncbi:aminopeptidase N [Dyella flagellata]|uniref:Aminopeptidase N n=1 Tax=Dyella flagellata TaxID=1867833 RepID=A0ABQ5XCF7_9GAMM|nr:aminopeptidase N [Dyella flagellata]GLQ88929.1 aminopeptidase N [Dyella flagellata]